MELEVLKNRIRHPREEDVQVQRTEVTERAERKAEVVQDVEEEKEVEEEIPWRKEVVIVQKTLKKR